MKVFKITSESLPNGETKWRVLIDGIVRWETDSEQKAKEYERKVKEFEQAYGISI